jgi:hypothetical protein
MINIWFVPKSLVILARIKFMYIVTGTCFIHKMYALSSSLLQGKYLPFSSSPLRLNIGLLYTWEKMTMMALLHMVGLENSECICKIQRKQEVAVSVSMTKK